jgi:hypothetical protein
MISLGKPVTSAAQLIDPRQGHTKDGSANHGSPEDGGSIMER